MIHLRKGCILGVYFLLFISTIACGSGGRSTPASNQKSPSGPIETSEVILGESGPALILFAGSKSDRLHYERLIDEFNHLQAGVQVQYIDLPEEYLDIDTYYHRLASTGHTFLAGGNIPWGAAHYFRDLQPLVDADPAFDSNDFWPGSLDACRDHENRLLGLPVNIRFLGIFFDMDAFDRAGLPHPSPGWTVNDFQRSVVSLAKDDAGETRYGYAELYPHLLSVFVSAAIQESEGEIETELLMAEIEWYVDLVRTGAVYLPSGENENPDEDHKSVWEAMFSSEQPPAMWPGSLEDLITPVDAPFLNAINGRVGFAPFPAAPDGSLDNTSPAWVDCVAISAGAVRPHNAWDWVKFLSERLPVQTQPWDITYAPGRMSATDAGGYFQAFPENYEPAIRFILMQAWYYNRHREATNMTLLALPLAVNDPTDFVKELDSIKAKLAAAPKPTPKPTPVIAVTPKPTLPPGTVLIKYHYRGSMEEEQALHAAAAEYHRRNPGVFVDVNTDFYPAPGKDVLLQYTENFDCFTTYLFNMPVQRLDLLYDLKPLVEAEGSWFLQDYDPVLIEVFSQGGSLYGLSSQLFLEVISYNIDLLARRGLSPPSPDWTFDEFLKFIAAASSNKPQDPSYGFLYNQWDDFLLAGLGSPWINLESDQPVALLDSPEFAASLNWLNQQIKDKVLLVNNSFDPAVGQAFRAGKVAFWVTYLEGPSLSSTSVGLNFRVGVTPLPAIEKSQRISSWRVKGHYLSKQSAQPGICWGWIKFLSEQPAVFHGIPARKSTAESPDWEALVGRDNASIYRQAIGNTIRNFPLAGNKFSLWPLYISGVGRALTAMINEVDYLSLLPGLQRSAEIYLNCISNIDTRWMTGVEMDQAFNSCILKAGFHDH